VLLHCDSQLMHRCCKFFVLRLLVRNEETKWDGRRPGTWPDSGCSICKDAFNGVMVQLAASRRSTAARYASSISQDL
jgi:hypothetical protein